MLLIQLYIINQFFQVLNRPHNVPDCGHNDSLIIILTALEKCLSNQSKDTVRYGEAAMNVKLLLREICQFFGINLYIYIYKKN